MGAKVVLIGLEKDYYLSVFIHIYISDNQLIK